MGLVFNHADTSMYSTHIYFDRYNNNLLYKLYIFITGDMFVCCVILWLWETGGFVKEVPAVAPQQGVRVSSEENQNGSSRQLCSKY